MSLHEHGATSVWRLWIMVAGAVLAAAFTGCGSKAMSVPAPTAAQAISDFQQMAMDTFEQMAARPETAGGQLDILLETVEVRSQEYGEPFIGYRNLVQEVRKSWADKPSAKAVKDSIPRLREAATAMQGNEG